MVLKFLNFDFFEAQFLNSWGFLSAGVFCTAVCRENVQKEVQDAQETLSKMCGVFPLPFPGLFRPCY